MTAKSLSHIVVYGLKDSEYFEGAQGSESRKSQVLLMRPFFFRMNFIGGQCVMWQISEGIGIAPTIIERPGGIFFE